MRVIYYNPPIEEKNIICNKCKSKLGYVKRDIIVSDEQWESMDKNSYKRIIVKYIKCPVCHNHVVIDKSVDE